eukprot:TRINITY_DN1516_c0_g1_i4.p1 TRINITY_DN1516_c0_g1~~TRINITY_DN1516_c0_g1_i4.p1  ORF type:complete len:344 (+),score=99.99 TRINITY_DN1516_c0_g1_i4:86-1117(+)
MAKHILCTGGAGYIGSHTYLKLLEAGFQVSIMDNYLNANKKVLPRLEELSGKPVTVYEADMCDPEAMDKLFAEHKFDGVIHFAGLKAVGESVAKPIWYYENNIRGTLNVLKAMEKNDCNFIVFSSSATVYKPCEEPLDEQKPTGCSNPYGWTKYMIEQILIDAAKANEKMGVAILRYFNPVGAHPSGKIGEAPNGIPNNLMPFVQQVAVGRREALSVFGNDYNTPDGTGVRDYIHVEDLAEGHVCALNNIMKMGKGTTIHNLGSGKGVSVLDMVKAFEKASGKTVATKIVDRRPGDLATVVCDPSKANKELEWSTKRNLEDMCNSVWKWVSANPYGYDDPPAA